MYSVRGIYVLCQRYLCTLLEVSMYSVRDIYVRCQRYLCTLFYSVVGCISDQAKEINESLSGIDSEIDSLLDGADELMTEIDDLINSLAPVHNGISV